MKPFKSPMIKAKSILDERAKNHAILCANQACTMLAAAQAAAAIVTGCYHPVATHVTTLMVD